MSILTFATVNTLGRSFPYRNLVSSTSWKELKFFNNVKRIYPLVDSGNYNSVPSSYKLGFTINYVSCFQDINSNKSQKLFAHTTSLNSGHFRYSYLIIILRSIITLL